MKSAASLPRRGFTLVELLMVITIIGMLMALLMVGANYAIVRARQAQTTLLIDTLDQAVQNAKSQYGLYPPDCSNLAGNNDSSGTGAAYRQARILSYFRKAFPKMVLPQGYSGNPPSSASPPAGSLQFLSQRAFGNTSQITTPSGFTLGDLDNLDPAEAMVFFLGGPPAGPAMAVKSSNGTVYAYSLAGWSSNASNPFSNTGQRGTSIYEFQTQRLGDADGDGWPEYYPPTGEIPQPPNSSANAPANPVPPFVYFDAQTYEHLFAFTGGSSSGVAPIPGNSYSTGYPYADSQFSTNMQTQMSTLQTYWGVALPYVNGQSTNPAFGPGVNDYVNPAKFQIIAAGADGRYSTGVSMYFRFFPNAISSAPANVPNPYTQADFDNLANFTTGRLQDAQQ